MMYAIISGILFGISMILLKYFISFSFPDIFFNIFSYLTAVLFGIAFIMFQLNLRKNDLGTTNALCTCTLTIVSVFLAVLFFKESFDLKDIIGTLIIIISIILLALKK